MMKKPATQTVQISGLAHGPSRTRVGGGVRVSLPRRLLTLAVLLLAAAFGGVFAVAQAQEAEGP